MDDLVQNKFMGNKSKLQTKELEMALMRNRCEYQVKKIQDLVDLLELSEDMRAIVKIKNQNGFQTLIQLIKDQIQDRCFRTLRILEYSPATEKARK